MRSFAKTLVVVVVGLAWSGCRDERGPTPPDGTGQCESDEDCDGAYCFQDTCVECFKDEQCNTHQRCDENVCAQLGAEDPSQTLNAHGNWRGTPGQPNYVYVDSCETDADCGVGQICNPFTLGCISAADFRTDCGANNKCDGTGPNGEVLACEPESNKCYPAPRCVAEYNCEGYEEFGCDSGAGVCQFIVRECTPPAEVTSDCPMEPKEQGDCMPGLFCSPLGRCVQCTCDLDCDAAGGLPHCYTSTGRCVTDDFCTSAGECDQPAESCDRLNQICKPRCEIVDDCPDEHYCDEDDHVCRPSSELPCDPDAFEPNQERETAASLTAPARDTSTQVPADAEEELTLCDTSTYDDRTDWYSIHLERGDHLSIRGSSETSLDTQMIAYAPDGSTQLDQGAITDVGSDLLEFTANSSDTYFIEIRADFGASGSYRLELTNTQGEVCSDSFEETLGPNNTPEQATVLDEAGTAPGDCTWESGTADGAHAVDCASGVLTLCEGDVDYYVVHAYNNSMVTATLSNFAGDLEMDLFGPFVRDEPLDTDRVADRATTSDSVEETVGGTRMEGRFLVRVRRYNGDRTPYDLRVEVSDGPTCEEDVFDAETSTSPLDPDGLNDFFDVASGLDVTPTTPGEAVQFSNLALCIGDTDWYQIGLEDGGTLLPLEAGARVTAELTDITAQGSDTLIVKIGTSAEDMDHDPGSPDSFTMTATGEPLYVSVSIIGGGTDVATYTLNVSYATPPACDPDGMGDDGTVTNDTPDEAYLLDPADSTYSWPSALGDSARAEELSLCSLDVDWYEIAVPADAMLLAKVEYDPRYSEAGLALYDETVLNSTNLDANELPDTGQVAVSEITGRGMQRVIGETPDKAYLVVYNTGGWPLDYDLEVELVSLACTDDAYEQNDSWDAAAPITLSQVPDDPRLLVGWVDLGTMCSSDDESDWFSFSAGPGDTIAANVYYEPNQGNLDLYLYEPGPAGISTQLDYSYDDSNSTGLLDVAYAIPTGGAEGDYLLHVEPWDIGGSNSFENRYFVELLLLRACVGDALEPSSAEEPAVLTIGETYNDLSLCNEEDVYAVTPEASGKLTICAYFSHEEGDIDLLVFEDETQTLIVGGSRTDTDNERARISVTGGHTYYPVVYTEQDEDPLYSLSVLSGDVACP